MPKFNFKRDCSLFAKKKRPYSKTKVFFFFGKSKTRVLICISEFSYLEFSLHCRLPAPNHRFHPVRRHRSPPVSSSPQSAGHGSRLGQQTTKTASHLSVADFLPLLPITGARSVASAPPFASLPPPSTSRPSAASPSPHFCLADCSTRHHPSLSAHCPNSSESTTYR